MFAAQEVVFASEHGLKKAQASLRDLAERQIPELMQAIGVKEFTTMGGVKIVLDSAVNVSVRKDDRERVWDWMIDNGYGNLVKRTISVALKRGQEELAGEVVAYLKEQKNLLAREDRKVESQTLKKFVREKLEEGADLPTDILNIFQYNFAKITEGKPEPVFEGE